MESIQQAFAVFFVLALLGGTLFWLRGKGLAHFSIRTAKGNNGRRIQLMERVALSTQHSLHLVKIGGRELLIAVSPAGCTVLDNQVGQSEIASNEKAMSR